MSTENNDQESKTSNPEVDVSDAELDEIVSSINGMRSMVRGNWVRLAQSMIKVQKTNKIPGGSMTAWVAEMAEACGLKEASIWRAYTAYRNYQELRFHMKEKDSVELPEIEKMPDHMGAEKIEILIKLLRVLPKERIQPIINDCLSEQGLSRAKLRTLWISYRPMTEGRAMTGLRFFSELSAQRTRQEKPNNPVTPHRASVASSVRSTHAIKDYRASTNVAPAEQVLVVDISAQVYEALKRSASCLTSHNGEVIFYRVMRNLLLLDEDRNQVSLDYIVLVRGEFSEFIEVHHVQIIKPGQNILTIKGSHVHAPFFWVVSTENIETNAVPLRTGILKYQNNELVVINPARNSQCSVEDELFFYKTLLNSMTMRIQL